jgi:hypothetical protein
LQREYNDSTEPLLRATRRHVPASLEVRPALRGE